MNRSLNHAVLALAAAATFSMIPSASAADPTTVEGAPAWRFGTELDALPYATGGYYGSFVAARGAQRIRGVVARSTVPGFMVKEGFEEKRTDAFALLVDQFLGAKRKRQEGFWVGGGVELWRNRIQREGYSEKASYNNVMLTVGGGYVWKFSRHFYLNPWAGVHFAVAGARSVNVAGGVYEQPRFTPEASIKIGYVFQ